MIDISDGLSSELLHLCKASDKGARIYLNRLPIAKQTYAMADELHSDPVVAALNGGDDYELLFTVPLARRQEVFALGVDVIGHMTEAGTRSRHWSHLTGRKSRCRRRAGNSGVLRVIAPAGTTRRCRRDAVRRGFDRFDQSPFDHHRRNVRSLPRKLR